jgi:hypothetical protein
MTRYSRQRLRATAGLAAGIAVALTLPGTPAAAAAARPPAPVPAPPTAVGPAAAAAQAKKTGKPVAVTAATTAGSTLTANANGSFTLTQTAQPVRKLVSGRWKDLDATLVADADGRLRPAVAAGDLRLSGGGAGPVATMAGGGRSLALTLPFSLPKPSLDGPTATYAAVLPGVDLAVTADDQGGFSEVLVVADAEAATNPQLAELTMDVTADGVTLSKDAAGNIAGTDVNHRTVVTAPAPTMWDSAAPSASTPTVSEPRTGRRLGTGSGMAAASSPAAPGIAAHVAPLGVGLTGHRITLTPPRAMLAAATWPVYLDPAWSWGAATNGWAVIDDSHPATKYWKNSPSDQNDMQSGKDPEGTGEVRRLLMNFPVDTSKLTKDVIISAATLNITETWSYNCTGTNVDIYAPTAVVTATNASWNAWANVDLGTRNDRVSASHGHSTSCPAAGVGFDISTGMKAAATAGRTNQTFVIKAADEGDDHAWKRWSPSTPKITVTYDHKPNTPSGLHTSPTTACTGSTVGDGDVKLYATVSDPDGGMLTENFTVWKTGTGTSTGGSLTNVASGSGSTPYTIPKSWMEGIAAGAATYFSWNVTAAQNDLTSTATATCRFLFDPTRQHEAEISAAPPATLGSPVRFDITYVKNPGETTAPSSYQYQINAGPISTVAANAAGAATIDVVPMRTVNRLSVVSVSTGANVGGASEQIFTAALPAPAADADLNGDGNADLLTAGGVNGIPSGAWLATGTGTTQAPAVDTAATNIGTNGTGVNVVGSPADFDGAQLITGRFTGTNLQDLLYYQPSTGGGGILAGNNAGEPIRPGDDNQHTLSAGILTDYTAGLNEVQPFTVANAGNSADLDNGFQDLIGTSGDAIDGYHLIYYPNQGGPASYPMGFELTTPAPDGTMAWNAWTIATAERSGGTTDMFLWNRSTGALSRWAGLHFGDDGNGNQTLTYTPAVLADGVTTTFQKGAAVSLRAADINRDGTLDLWTVGAGGQVTAWLVSGGAISAQPAQQLSTPTHSWLLNDATEGRANTAHDYAGNLDATATSGNASFDTGDLFSPDVTFTAANIDGMNTSSAAVDTNADFTISLWTKPTAYSGNVLSQDGQYGTLFKIWPSSDTTWKFAFQKSDVVFASATWDTASSAAGTAKLGFWYHITVTYQASTRRMQLYLNDIPAGSAVRSSTWSYANTKLQLGSMKVGVSSWDWHYDGQLANVQTWNRVIPPVLLANWDMGGGSGTTITDQSGFGNTATLAGGYTWNTTGHNSAQNGSVTFNGTTGYAQAGSALVQPSTTSFSVASWVYLTDSSTTTDRVFVSQPGTNRAPFYLMYGAGTNSWQFVFSQADVPTGPTQYVAADPNPAVRNTWVHVAGTYDAATHTARLYVNGNLVATRTGITTWNSAGKTYIGRSGATWWQGKLDAVRVYLGALTGDQVRYVMDNS